MGRDAFESTTAVLLHTMAALSAGSSWSASTSTWPAERRGGQRGGSPRDWARACVTTALQSAACMQRREGMDEI